MYLTVPTGIKVQMGTTPFRGVPLVPSPTKSPDTDYQVQDRQVRGLASKMFSLTLAGYVDEKRAGEVRRCFSVCARSDPHPPSSRGRGGV
jgi:hypothetical protein